jgi:hypothetical protein
MESPAMIILRTMQVALKISFRRSGERFGGDGTTVTFLTNNQFLYSSTKTIDSTWIPIWRQCELYNYAPLTMFGIIPVNLPNPQDFAEKSGIVLSNDASRLITDTSVLDPDQKLVLPIEPLFYHRRIYGGHRPVATEMYGLFLLMDNNAATNPAH